MELHKKLLETLAEASVFALLTEFSKSADFPLIFRHCRHGRKIRALPEATQKCTYIGFLPACTYRLDILYGPPARKRTWKLPSVEGSFSVERHKKNKDIKITDNGQKPVILTPFH